MASATQPNPPALPAFTGITLVLITLALALATFMEVLDTSIANVAVPTISGNLGVATTEGTWLISSYALSSAISVPLTGWLARRIGEIKLFSISIILFSITSALCGFATDFSLLIVFRLLQGFVSGPMMPLSQTILLRCYPLKKRGLALGLWSMTIIVAPIMGPVLGGWITDNYSWPWIFYINVPVGIASAIITYMILNQYETETFKEKIDSVGLIALIIGVSSLQMMLDFGRDHDWFNSNFIIGLAIIAAVTLTFLLIWEFTEKNPIIDLSFFQDRNFSLGCLISSLGFMIFFGSVVIFPFWLQTIMGYTAELAGLATSPTGFVAFFIAPVLGRYLHHFNLKIVTSIAFIAFAIACFWSSHYTLDLSFQKIIIPRFLMGIGVALFFIPITTIILSNIPDHRLAGAAGLSNFLRTLSGAVGTALASTYWENSATINHSYLIENVSLYNQNTQAYQSTLESLGLQGQALTSLLNQTVTQHSYMLATKDFFEIAAMGFLALAITVWFTKPIKKTSNQSHAAH